MMKRPDNVIVECVDGRLVRRVMEKPTKQPVLPRGVRRAAWRRIREEVERAALADLDHELDWVIHSAEKLVENWKLFPGVPMLEAWAVERVRETPGLLRMVRRIQRKVLEGPVQKHRHGRVSAGGTVRVGSRIVKPRPTSTYDEAALDRLFSNDVDGGREYLQTIEVLHRFERTSGARSWVFFGGTIDYARSETLDGPLFSSVPQAPTAAPCLMCGRPLVVLNGRGRKKRRHPECKRLEEALSQLEQRLPEVTEAYGWTARDSSLLRSRLQIISNSVPRVRDASGRFVKATWKG